MKNNQNHNVSYFTFDNKNSIASGQSIEKQKSATLPEITDQEASKKASEKSVRKTSQSEKNLDEQSQIIEDKPKLHITQPEPDEEEIRQMTEEEKLELAGDKPM